MWYRFLFKCMWLGVPVLAFFGAVALVDPYCYFGTHGPVPTELKLKNRYHDGRTMPFSNMMWKLVEFKRAPQADVLLGDSRLSHFDLQELSSTSGIRYYNFGVPGGNYRTIDSVFHFVDGETTLRNVYIQVSFRAMDKTFDYDLFMEPKKLLDAPQLYLSNRRVLEASTLALYSWWFPDRVRYDQVPDDQWRIVLDMEQANADRFTEDTTVYARLQYIADRCRAEGARLVLMEYPTHPDVQAIYRDAGLGQRRADYLERLGRIAPVVDLDVPGLFPTDRSFWRDPLHLTTEAQRQLIAKVWGSHARVSRQRSGVGPDLPVPGTHDRKGSPTGARRS